MDSPPASTRPVQVTDLGRWKEEGKRFAMLTAYDYTTAVWLDRAGIPVLLVGDSVGGTMLGHHLRGGAPSTLEVTLEDIIHHGRAVSRGVDHALLVGDLPFLSYHLGLDQAMHSAGRLIKEAGMQAVKLEGAGPMTDVVRHLVERGVPVMGHLGLTPQWVNLLGGYRVQGRDEHAAGRIRAALGELDEAGAFAVVLEGVPGSLAQELTASTRMPTIGIGAGPGCDGQVLVSHDLLGLTAGPAPKFAKAYANLGGEILDAAQRFQVEVEAGGFPDAEHTRA